MRTRISMLLHPKSRGAVLIGHSPFRMDKVKTSILPKQTVWSMDDNIKKNIKTKFNIILLINKNELKWMMFFFIQERKQDFCRGVRPWKSKWNWRQVMMIALPMVRKIFIEMKRKVFYKMQTNIIMNIYMLLCIIYLILWICEGLLVAMKLHTMSGPGR